MTAPLVLMTLMLCAVTPEGWGDDCETVEIRAAHCEQAAAWAGAWMPQDWGVVAATCSEQRQASR
jgi:hypothetical protein